MNEAFSRPDDLIELPRDQVFKLPPMQHQLRCLMRSRDEIYWGIFSEMGTGKSKVLIDTASWLFSQGKINGLVIIAPKSACLSWAQQQIPTHMPDSIETRVVTWGSQSKGLDNQLKGLFQIEPLKLHVLIMNVDAVITDRGYDLLEKFLRSHDVLLAIDESTSIKNPKASRTKILTKLGRLARYRRILTGTPIANRPLDAFAQLQFLQDGCSGYSSWVAFRNRYAVTMTRYINGRRFEEIVGWTRLDELSQTINKISSRALKKDCLDLPDKIYEKRYIELAPEQQKYYNELRDQAMSELASGTLVAAPLIITRVLRLRQALCNLAPNGDGGVEFICENDPRLNEILAVIEEAGDQKILIWDCFIPSILHLVNTINKHYGEGAAAAFYGGVTQKERQGLIDQIQDKESKLRVLVLQEHTGGEAITLTGASLVIYNSNDWSLKTRKQSEDRCHRIGQTKNVTYIDIIAKNTVHETIIDALVDKENLADIVTGDALRRLLSG